MEPVSRLLQKGSRGGGDMPFSFHSLSNLMYLLMHRLWKGNSSIRRMPISFAKQAESSIFLCESVYPGMKGIRMTMGMPSDESFFALDKISSLGTPVYALCLAVSICLRSGPSFLAAYNRSCPVRYERHSLCTF